MEKNTYAALERTAVDVVAVELANGNGSVLMSVHLDESKSTVALEARLDNIAKVLEKRNEVGLGGVRSQVADVDGRLPLGGLVDNHVVRLHAVGREMVVSIRGGRGHAHGGHGLLLGDGGLALLVGPVATNGTGAEPLAVHGAQRLFSIRTVAEGDETVATRATRLHIPHDASLRDRTESGEGLEQDLIIDLVRKVTDENVEVVGRVLLGLRVGLVGPVDADFLASKSVNWSRPFLGVQSNLRSGGRDGR